MHKEHLHRSQTLLLVLLSSFPVVMALLCAPAFPNLEFFFEGSHHGGLKTMSSYLFGASIGILLSGMIANYLGQIRVLLLGLFFSLITTLCALWIGDQGNFSLFCFFRMIQGVCCASLGIAFLLLADFFAHHVTKRIFSSLFVLFAGIIAFSVSIGAVCTEYAGWQGCFLFMIVYTTLLLLFTFRFSSTFKHSVSMARALSQEGKDPFLLLYGGIGGLSISLLYLYATFSPFIAIDRIGLTPMQYGGCSLIAFIGLFVGCYFFQHDQKIARISLLAGIFYALLGSIAMQIFFVNQMVNFYTLFFLSLLILIAPALIYPKSVGVVLRETTHKTAAFLVIQAMSFLIPSLILSILLFTHIGKKTLPLSCGVCSLVALLLWFGLRAHHARKHK